MRLIRRFEERLMDEMATGDIPGNTHLYAGQEASAVGIRDDDPVMFLEHKMLYDMIGEVPDRPYTICPDAERRCLCGCGFGCSCGDRTAWCQHGAFGGSFVWWRCGCGCGDGLG